MAGWQADQKYVPRSQRAVLSSPFLVFRPICSFRPIEKFATLKRTRNRQDFGAAWCDDLPECHTGPSPRLQNDETFVTSACTNSNEYIYTANNGVNN